MEDLLPPLAAPQPADDRRLVQVCLQRRRAEEDCELLQNRIRMLRQEEQKANKRAEEFQQRTDQLVHQRVGREAEKLRKQEELREKQAQEERDRQLTLRRRARERAHHTDARAQTVADKCQVAREDRARRREGLAVVEQEVQNQQAYARQRRDLIRKHEERSKALRKRAEAVKREDARRKYEASQFREEEHLRVAE